MSPEEQQRREQLAMQTHLLALHGLVLAISRALTAEMQATARAEWQKEHEAARNVLLHSTAPEEMLAAFDRQIERLHRLKVFQPPQD